MSGLAGVTGRPAIVATTILSIAMSSASVPLLTGCERAGGPRPVVAPGHSKPAGGGEFPGAISQYLGVVRAGETRKHVFRIPNDTGSTWSVRQVQSTCSCTVAEASPDRVGRGESLVVKVDYKAPPRSTEDSRSVHVVLEDDAGTLGEVVLQVRASVREPMTILPASLRIDARTEEPAPTAVQVENWTASDWRALRAESTIDWVTCRVQAVRLPAPQGDRIPRQAWRLEVAAEPAARRLANGNASEAQLVLTSVGAEPAVAATVPVQLIGGEKVRAVPSLLVLRQDEGGRPSEARTTLRFSGDVRSFGTQNVTIDHRLMPGLSFDWKVKSPREWELVARLAARSSQDGFPSKGTVVLSFPGDQLPPLKLPVYCSFQR